MRQRSNFLFCMWKSRYLASSVEEIISPPLSRLGTHTKNQLVTDIWNYFWPLNLFNWSICLSLYKNYSFNYCSFIVSFENVKCESFTVSVPDPHPILAIWNFLHFHEFWNQLVSFCKEDTWDFDRALPWISLSILRVVTC